MNIIIKYFGQITDITGLSKEFLEVRKDTDLSKIKEIIECKYDLKESTFRLALNQEFNAKNLILKENDEVALLPPFAGG